MLIAAIICNCLAAVLFIVAAMKYGMGPVPLNYHKLILDKERTALTPYQSMILRGLYRALAGALLAIGLLIIALSLGPVREGELWAEVAVLLAGGAFVSGSYLTPRRVEEETGVQTPWRLALLMGGLLVIGFVLAQLN
jgi:hypothetical protein